MDPIGPSVYGKASENETIQETPRALLEDDEG